METPSNDSTKSASPNLLSRVLHSVGYLKWPLIGAVASFVVAIIILGSISSLSPSDSTSVYGHIDDQPQVLLDCRDLTLAPTAQLWVNEVARRFHEPTAVLLCHGGSIVKDQWVLKDNPGSDSYGESCEDALKALDEEHALYPNRIIVCLACNPLHLAVHNRPWLYYSPSEVWVIPDRYLMSESANPIEVQYTNGAAPAKFPNALDDRSSTDPDVVGSPFELIQGN